MEMEETIPKFVIKRTGEKVKFDAEKIEHAVFRAFSGFYEKNDENQNRESAKKIALLVVQELETSGKDELHVEEIQDIVEKILMKEDPNVAKAYILYRNKHAKMRAIRATLGIPKDELKIPINSLTVLAARYLLKDDNGKIVETPKQLFERVANAIASPEKRYGKSEAEVRKIADDFYNAMTSFKFMPNSPTLMNAGTKDGQLSACFVLPVADSIPEIFDAIKYTAIIHKSGGGTGFSFSRLRPRNDIVKTTGSVASGPLSFMKIFNSATEEIKQGGKRRGQTWVS